MVFWIFNLNYPWLFFSCNIPNKPCSLQSTDQYIICPFIKSRLLFTVYVFSAGFILSFQKSLFYDLSLLAKEQDKF
jgi:hypothetical protein